MLYLFFQNRQVVFYHIPNQLQVKTEVFMGYKISERNNLLPGNCGVVVFQLLRKAASRLAHNFELPLYGKTKLKIFINILF